MIERVWRGWIARENDAIRAFAGEELDLAHVAPKARELLSRWDEQVSHFDIAFDDP